MPETLRRSARVAAAADEGQDMPYPASLASDEPCSRPGYTEILDCSPGAVDLSRAKEGLPLIRDHNPTRLVGRVYDVRADGKRVRGFLKFFDTQAGREALAEVKAGHREMSVSYQVIKDQPEDGGKTVRVKRWALLEASIVSIPVDPTIGVFRVMRDEGNSMSDDTNTSDAGDQQQQQQHLTRSQRRAAGQAQSGEHERVNSIRAIARSYKDWLQPNDAIDAVANGTSVEQFQNTILQRMQSPATDVTVPYGPAVIHHRDDPESRFLQFSLPRSLAASIDPARHMRSAGMELEISRELARNSPLLVEGSMVPISALVPAIARRAMNAGTSNAGGSTIATGMAIERLGHGARAG